jgi:hypothetical protein
MEADEGRPKRTEKEMMKSKETENPPPPSNKNNGN